MHSIGRAPQTYTRVHTGENNKCAQESKLSHTLGRLQACHRATSGAHERWRQTGSALGRQMHGQIHRHDRPARSTAPASGTVDHAAFQVPMSIVTVSPRTRRVAPPARAGYPHRRGASRATSRPSAPAPTRTPVNPLAITNSSLPPRHVSRAATAFVAWTHTGTRTSGDVWTSGVLLRNAALECSLASTPPGRLKAYLDALQQVRHGLGGVDDFSLASLAAEEDLHFLVGKYASGA
jgi:hypothetical protein